MDTNIIEQIYEAAVLGEKWPRLLQKIAEGVQARGAVIVTLSAGIVNWIVSPDIKHDVNDYMNDGWGADQSRIEPLYMEQHA